MAHDVFISYSAKDKTAADATCALLERRRIRCWIAPRDVPAGAKWGTSILEAIRATRVMVLIFSDNANASHHVVSEVERAVNLGVIVVPLRIEDTTPKDDLELFLSRTHWLDAFHPPLDQHIEVLASRVRAILDALIKKGKPVPVPPLGATPRPVVGPGPTPGALPSATSKELRIRILMVVIFLVAAFLVVGWYFGFEQPAEQGREQQLELAQQQATQKEKDLEAQEANDAAERARLMDDEKKANDEAEQLKEAAQQEAAQKVKVLEEQAAADAAEKKKAADEAEQLKEQQSAQAAADEKAAQEAKDKEAAQAPPPTPSSGDAIPVASIAGVEAYTDVPTPAVIDASIPVAPIANDADSKAAYGTLPVAPIAKGDIDQPAPPFSRPAKADEPWALVIPDTPGFVKSPFAESSGPVDVRNFPPNSAARCPYTQRVFAVPNTYPSVRSLPDGHPMAIVIPNKTGFVRSPFAEYASPVDVRNFPAGTAVRCPYTNKIFVVPQMR